MKVRALGPIESRIHTLRGQRVMLDADLARLYDAPTKALVRAVKRNPARFPSDFMFQLSKEEFQDLRSQSGTSRLWGGRRYLPYAFTEQGVAMLSSVLQSVRAVLVNVEIMRAFVRARATVLEHRDLTRRLDELEARYDIQFKVVFDAMRALVTPPPSPAKRIGFKPERSEG